jgi:NAD(P)-dependent dehydrogenase (short-subunit alcohol dehydrogenase family)
MTAPVILITGALTGIGRATALAFAKEGATVVVSGRRELEGKALENELGSLGAEAAFILNDVRLEDDVRNLVEQTVRRFGRLNVAINNAGTEGKPGPLTEQTSDSYTGMFDTNVGVPTALNENRDAAIFGLFRRPPALTLSLKSQGPRHVPMNSSTTILLEPGCLGWSRARNGEECAS